MDSLRINTYKPQYNYSYNQSFQGRLKSLNDLNPISRYTDIYMKKSANISRTHITKTQPDIEPYIKIVKMNTNKTTEISAWDINPDNSEKYVLFLHGMSQNVTNYQPLYSKVLEKKVGIFAVEYRGYGNNPESSISEDKFRRDIETAYKHLTETKGIKPENIIVIGHSMGGALATNFASKHPEVKSLILICPIVNAAKIGEKFALNKNIGEGIPENIKRFTDKIKPLKWLYSLRMSSLSKMKDNKVPTYIVQSENDMVTPLGAARTLAKIAKRRGVLKEIAVLKTGGHQVDSRKVNTISKFLDNILSD